MKKLFNLSICMLLSAIFFITPAFAKNKTYIYSNFKLSNGTNLNTKITLDKSAPYGKVHYYNSSSYDVRLYVEGTDEIKVIKPYSSSYIIWKKDILKKDYTISITQTKDILKGNFSLAKSDNKEDFEN